MDQNLIAVIVGFVEGVTEFLPVSSTGHMIIVGHMLGFDGPAADIFDVFVQLGAILSVIFIYKERFARFFTKEGWQAVFGTRGAVCSDRVLYRNTYLSLGTYSERGTETIAGCRSWCGLVCRFCCSVVFFFVGDRIHRAF